MAPSHLIHPTYIPTNPTDPLVSAYANSKGGPTRTRY